MPKASPPIERLMAHVIEAEGPLATACWLTTYYQPKDGYARLIAFRRTVLAHRLSYEHFVGPIPKELELDHLCRVRGCVNPHHLEPVTRLVNMLRGGHPSAIAHRTEVCKNGHPYNGDPYVNKDGKLSCRVCRHLSNQRRYLKS